MASVIINSNKEETPAETNDNTELADSNDMQDPDKAKRAKNKDKITVTRDSLSKDFFHFVLYGKRK